MKPNDDRIEFWKACVITSLRAGEHAIGAIAYADVCLDALINKTRVPTGVAPRDEIHDDASWTVGRTAAMLLQMQDV